MKKILMLIAGVLIFFSTHAQVKDAKAVQILQKTQDTIKGMQSCRFIVNAVYEVWDNGLGPITHEYKDDVRIKFPNKMYVTSNKEEGKKAMQYDGTTFKSYLFYGDGDNKYSEQNMKKPLMDMINEVKRGEGVDASEADFFYFSFLGNVLETSKKLVYMGERVMNKTNSFHILGQDISGTTFQFWIDMNSYLPVKASYAYLGQEQQPRYQASYSDWIINSPMSDSIFYYVPPAPSDVDD